MNPVLSRNANHVSAAIVVAAALAAAFSCCRRDRIVMVFPDRARSEAMI